MKGYIADFIKYKPLLWDLTVRDVKVKYRRSVLGLAWSILNPLLTMLVLTQVFGLLLKVQVENFPVYYIVGASLYNFFSEATTSSMHSVLSAGSLIKKVYVPKYIFPLEKCMFSLVNFLFSMIAVIIVMIFQQSPLHWTMLLFFIPVIYTFAFAVGISLILSALSVFFRDILHLYGVLLTVLLYLTPIIYPISLVQESFVMNIVRLNPLYYYVEYFRALLMEGTIPDLQTNLICIVSALFALGIGLLVFKKKQDKFILHI